jgi:hypothetical protein
MWKLVHVFRIVHRLAALCLKACHKRKEIEDPSWKVMFTFLLFDVRALCAFDHLTG